MKKLFVSVLAIAGLVACMNDEIVSVQKGNAIAFDSFVENTTRADKAVDPSTTTTSLDGFKVWGFMDQTNGILFDGEVVTGSQGAFTYTNTQYWLPGHDYYFAALAPKNSTNWTLNTEAANFYGAGILNFLNIYGTEDLLYAATALEKVSDNPGAVKFQFHHLLSKVKFTFENGFTNPYNTIVVRDVKMTAPLGGSINLAVENWWDNDDWQLTQDKVSLAFGDAGEIKQGRKQESANERFTIPASKEQEYVVTFFVDLYMGDLLAETYPQTVSVKGIALDMGKAYNFKATIDQTNIDQDGALEPIVFDVEEVVDFVESTYDYYFMETNNDETTVGVNNANGLQAVAEAIEEGTIPADANIVLGGNIDLSSTRAAVASNWTPIGTSEKPFTGTFDGKGYTIKNLALVESEAKEGKAYIGFFGFAEDVTIKNVTFENVYINIPCLDIDHSQGHIGAVVGSLEGTSTIENVTVKGDITVYATQDANGASRVAVVAGGNSYGDVTMKNVHVIANEGSSLIANNNTGALAGQLQGKMVFENCSSNINVTANKFFAGGLVGIAAGDSYIKNCHTTGDVAVVAGREGRHNDEYRVGGIAGGWADGKTKVFTLEGCSFTGNVSGKNADGAVAEPLDYMGYVGRGYTLNNCEGSKVIIDGTEFVQVGNAAPFGVYTINGCTPVSTADELVATLAAGKGVYFMNDITVAATKGGYDKAGILQNKAQTIDGAGHTLKVTGAGATWSCAIYTNGGVIRNLTVAGAMRGIFTAGQSTDLHIENVEFKNVIYTFNSDGKMPANPFGVYVSNSKVNGWTSHSDMHTEVVYTNCSFGEGSGYKYCRPYGKTAFVNCTFCAGYSIDKSKTTELTFTDCTFEE